MATKTYAQLTAETTIEDADLFASFRGALGPLKRLPASLIRSYVQAVPGPVVYAAKTANYTVLATDIGTIFDCTSSFTLSLTSAATVGEGFNFAVRNSGTGVITIDGDGSDTIDGRTTVLAYPGEAFEVICTGAGFITEGRAREVICFTGTASSVAEYEILQGFSDTEFQSFQVNTTLTGTSSGAKARVAFRAAGVYSGVHNFGSILNLSGTISGQSVTATTGIEITNHNRATGGVINIGAARATLSDRGPYAAFSMLESATGTTLTGTGNVITTTGITGAKFFYSAGNLDANCAFQVIGYR